MIDYENIKNSLEYSKKYMKNFELRIGFKQDLKICIIECLDNRVLIECKNQQLNIKIMIFIFNCWNNNSSVRGSNPSLFYSCADLFFQKKVKICNIIMRELS